MKIKHIILTLTTLLLTLSGCTRHNGDIGPYFGTWHVEKIEADGKEDDEYNDNLFFKFQSDVICMVVVNDAAHTRNEYWGTWSEDGNVLTLTYTYSDDKTQPGHSQYAPPAISHLPAGVSKLDIVRLKGDEMQLKYVSPNEITYKYYLKKW